MTPAPRDEMPSVMTPDVDRCINIAALEGMADLASGARNQLAAMRAEITQARSEVSALLAEAAGARAAQVRYETLEALLREAESASPHARFLVIDRRRIDRAIAESLAAASAQPETPR